VELVRLVVSFYLHLRRHLQVFGVTVPVVRSFMWVAILVLYDAVLVLCDAVLVLCDAGLV
jgi:hypothetical protein